MRMVMKIMKIRSIHLYSMFIAMQLGCQFNSNEIYYDNKLEAIRSTDKALLSYIEIKVDYSIYVCKRKKTKTTNEDCFFLKSINDDYTIYFYGTEYKMPFRIISNSVYIITNYSEGDRSSSSLSLTTNSLANVVKVSMIR
jgi:hypothetical protein